MQMIAKQHILLGCALLVAFHPNIQVLAGSDMPNESHNSINATDATSILEVDDMHPDISNEEYSITETSEDQTIQEKQQIKPYMTGLREIVTDPIKCATAVGVTLAAGLGAAGGIMYKKGTGFFNPLKLEAAEQFIQKTVETIAEGVTKQFDADIQNISQLKTADAKAYENLKITKAGEEIIKAVMESIQTPNTITVSGTSDIYGKVAERHRVLRKQVHDVMDNEILTIINGLTKEEKKLLSSIYTKENDQKITGDAGKKTQQEMERNSKIQELGQKIADALSKEYDRYTYAACLPESTKALFGDNYDTAVIGKYYLIKENFTNIVMRGVTQGLQSTP